MRKTAKSDLYRRKNSGHLSNCIEHCPCGALSLWNTVLVEHCPLGTLSLWCTDLVEHCPCGALSFRNTVLVVH